MQKEVLEILINLGNNNIWDLAVPLACGIHNNPELFSLQKLNSIENMIKIGKKLSSDKKQIQAFNEALEKFKTIKELEKAEKQEENIELQSLLNYL